MPLWAWFAIGVVVGLNGTLILGTLFLTWRDSRRRCRRLDDRALLGEWTADEEFDWAWPR